MGVTSGNDEDTLESGVGIFESDTEAYGLVPVLHPAVLPFASGTEARRSSCGLGSNKRRLHRVTIDAAVLCMTVKQVSE